MNSVNVYEGTSPPSAASAVLGTAMSTIRGYIAIRPNVGASSALVLALPLNTSIAKATKRADLLKTALYSATVLVTSTVPTLTCASRILPVTLIATVT